VVARKSSTPAAPPLGQAVPLLPPVLPPPSLLLHLRPQELLLRVVLLEEVAPGLHSVSTPPAFWGESGFRPVEGLPGQAVPRLDLVEPRCEPLGSPSYRTNRPLALRQPVLLGVRPPAHWHASTHFFSEISCLRLAQVVG